MSPCLSRRALLGAGGAALALTACGGSPVPVPVLDGVPAGGRIVGLAEVTDGAAVELELDGRRVLLVRTAEDTVVGWDAECPHQGCTVRALDGGGLGCPCHGSEFDPATGDVLQGPATTGLTALPVAVSGSDVVLA